jgi:hypothetical protein
VAFPDHDDSSLAVEENGILTRFPDFTRNTEPSKSMVLASVRRQLAVLIWLLYDDPRLSSGMEKTQQ